MHNFIITYIIDPFKDKWKKGIFLLALWTIAFVALPSISGWFLAICSVVFVTANIGFSYLVPSAIIRLLAISRTATRYFERLENHKTTMAVQQRLQLKIFKSVARLPYFKKQISNNSSLLENSTNGIDHILNHILLWLLPFASLILTISVYFIFIMFFSGVIAIEFLISSVIILFLLPQIVHQRNKILYMQLKDIREENHHSLIQTFRGRIEITKYNIEDKAINSNENKRVTIERLESKIQFNSFRLQLIAGLGFSLIALFLLWHSSQQGMEAPLAIGIFFGIMAQAELSEMLFSGKSEKSSVENNIKDINTIIEEGNTKIDELKVDSNLDQLHIVNLNAMIPETSINVGPLSLNIKKGEWVALYGETGKGKSTLLNSLFYPEYVKDGELYWNDEKISNLPVPKAIYVTQKAYLLTGTLRENFEGYSDNEIEDVLKTADLTTWRSSLSEGLETWLGENGETLSGGQRKKLLLAQALLKQPQILVVDEPTAGISTENAIEIFQNIHHHYPAMTILMATHLKEFEKVADKVVSIL